jgi:hypothetical protein
MDEQADESNVGPLQAVSLGELEDIEIHCSEELAPYIEPIHRAAVGMAQPEAFGIEGRWLFQDQIDQLRVLYLFYDATEAPLIKRAVEAYLKAQLKGFYTPPQR